MKSLDGDAPTVLQRSAVARGWLRSLGLGAALASLVTGCAALRPTTSRLTISMHEPLANTSSDSFSPRGRPSTRDCLLVLLPGIGDGPDDFERNGFLRDVAAQASHCEVVLVDAHLMFYLSQTMTERIAVDVLHQARRHGYRSVWLVGISLGGYGAILTARAHPDLVDGVVLIAPMLGVPPREDGVAQEIMDAGGLHRWPGLSPWLPAPRHHFPRLDGVRRDVLGEHGLAAGALPTDEGPPFLFSRMEAKVRRVVHGQLVDRDGRFESGSPRPV
ncbi:MAG: alpha/beta fold hydrolase [Sandaracinaceae bacterium]|nr:alpha/beta fold hydrolase [Sandaracinaceae bacterium]